MDPSRNAQELRVRNVSLHRRGKPDKGTLYLTRHHLIFSYYPNGADGKTGAPELSAAGTNTSTLSNGLDGAAASQPVAGQATTDNSEAKASPRQPKPRPKEIYVPYPTINHCTLRPSHTQNTYRPAGHESQAQGYDGEEDSEAFPPTYGTSSYARPSTDSANPAPYSSPRRPSSPVIVDATHTHGSSGNARPPAMRIKCKDFVIFALHFNASSGDKSPDEAARQAFYTLRSRCCVSSIEDMYAFHFRPPAEETCTGGQVYDVRREFARMGISPKAADGPGNAWRVTEINHDYAYSSTYPAVLCVPRAVSDNILKYCGAFRSKSRIPALAYLHPNGGSITRSSQPMVGVQGKRNVQDEKLVSAIFSSHTPTVQSPEDSPRQAAATSIASPSSTNLEEMASEGEALDAELPADLQLATDEGGTEKAQQARQKRVYGSTRRNLIVDARPRINMIANKAAGGGIEDVANYMAGSEMPIEKVFLNIANIHAMRSSLEKVVESLGSSDYLDLPPNQEALRKSGWLGHIAGILDGAEMVARVVGLGGSHALIHCSDGWDRTSQISALAQVMLDPHYRTLKGFITLLQKDFLSFGHKFKHRQGVEGSEKWFEIENERIQPTRARENNSADTGNFQVLGSKALSGARSWFEKNRGNIFGQQQQAGGRDDFTEISSSRPGTPPPNPVLHSTPSPKVKEEKRKMDEKEVAPIFHQFLDSVYQLLHQTPSAFEFNERFLRRLLYQSNSGQYGEFLFNNERERWQWQDKTASVWGYFLAREREFTNDEYVAKVEDPLLFPRRKGYEREVEVRWWTTVFGRKDDEMNVARALRRATAAETAGLSQQGSSLSLDDTTALRVTGTSRGDETAAVAAAAAATTVSIRAARSTPALNELGEDERWRASSGGQMPHQGSGVSRSSTAKPSDDEAQLDVSGKQRQVSEPGMSSEKVAVMAARAEWEKEEEEEEEDGGDPLGVRSSAAPQASKPAGREGLDFAAFAQANAFRDR